MKTLYPFVFLNKNCREHINKEELIGGDASLSALPSIASPIAQKRAFTRGLSLFVLVGLLLFSRPALQAQEKEKPAEQKLPALSVTFNPRYFINNIVDIGLSDFGIITGEDSTSIYFIAVRRSQAGKNAYPEPIASTIKSAKFYSSSYRAKATKVNEAVFGAFTVVLYQSPKPAESKWERNFYYSLSYKKGELSTFRDKWVSDKIWAVHNAKIEMTKQPKLGMVTLRVPKDAGIAKGMPVINSDGFIAGIFAESSLGKTSVTAISMDEIAKQLYTKRNDCNYFSMVEWGKEDNRCVLEAKALAALDEKAKLEEEEKAKRALAAQAKKEADEEKDSLSSLVKAARKAEKVRFFEYGIHANFLPGPLQVENPDKENYLKTRIYSVGLAFHFNLDKKRANRVTLKPRYGNFYERNDPGLWTSPDEEMKIVISTYQYVELPVVFERQLFSTGKYSMAIGAGYAPGWVFDQRYTWVDKTAMIDTDQNIPRAEGFNIRHRLLGELHFYEFKLGRLSAVYARDFSGYPNADLVVTHNGADYTPFAGRKDAWYLGLEVEIRLRGR